MTQELSDSWVLTDPTSKGLNGLPTYIKLDGQVTSNLQEAKLFKTRKEALEFRESKTGIPYFIPKRLKDCLDS